MFPTPTVVGDQVLIASCAGTFFALDRQTGDVNWTFDIREDGGSQFHSEMVVSEDRVIFGTDGRHGNGHAVDVLTGELLWTHPCGSALSVDLLQVRDTIIGVTRMSDSDDLVCIDIESGDIIWSVPHDRIDEYTLHRYNPVVVEDVVYWVDHEMVRGYDVRDGSPVVEIDPGGRPAESLTVVEGRWLYGETSGGRVFRVDLEHGVVDAAFEVGDNVTGAPGYLDGSVFLRVRWRTRDSRLVVLDAGLTTVQWEWRPADRNDYGTIAHMVSDGDAIVIATQHGRVISLDRADGTVRWIRKVDEAVRSVGFYEDVMYVGSIPGTIYATRRPRLLPAEDLQRDDEADDGPASEDEQLETAGSD